ncbi:hypothetical protein ACSZNR_14325 [Aeromonas caviae]
MSENPPAMGGFFMPAIPGSPLLLAIAQSMRWPLTTDHELPTIAQTHHVSEITS